LARRVREVKIGRGRGRDKGWKGDNGSKKKGAKATPRFRRQSNFRLKCKKRVKTKADEIEEKIRGTSFLD